MQNTTNSHSKSIIKSISRQSLIKDALFKINIEELKRELNLNEKYLYNYLNQLISNTKIEIFPGITIIPLNGGQQIQDFIWRYNQIIISNWLKESHQEYKYTNCVKDFVSQILKDYAELQVLAKYFQNLHLLKYKDLLISVLTVQITEIFDEKKIQVSPNIFMVSIRELSSEITSFYQFFNEQIAFSLLEKDFNLCKETQQNQQQQITQQNQNQLNQFNSQLISFIHGFELKLPPDNQKKQYFTRPNRRIKSKSAVELGFFQQYDHCQTFKLLCNLSNQLFETEQFIEFLKEKKNKLINFDIEKLDQLFKFPSQTNGQTYITNQLFIQLENTKINMREAKENFYKFVFISLNSVLKQELPQWAVKQYNESAYRRLPNKQGTNRNNKKFIQIFENRRFYWFDNVKLMLQKFKILNLAKKYQKPDNIKINFYIAIQRIKALLILFESELIFGILQQFSQN